MQIPFTIIAKPECYLINLFERVKPRKVHALYITDLHNPKGYITDVVHHATLTSVLLLNHHYTFLAGCCGIHRTQRGLDCPHTRHTFH